MKSFSRIQTEYSKVNNNFGFSLMATLIAVLIMGITFAAMISMITVQQKEGRALYQQLARGSLKYAMLQTLRNPQNCTCQFNSLPSTPHGCANNMMWIYIATESIYGPCNCHPTAG